MKRMWDKKKLEEMIEEGGSKITVDSELSNTSENPVQNKVIYGALEDKQDSLPSISEQTGKFLKVGSDGLEWDNPLPPVTASEYGKYLKANSSTGNLEWASGGGGGGTKYLHHIYGYATLKSGSYNTYFALDIPSEDSTSYTTTTFKQLLSTLGYTSASQQYRYRTMIFINGYPNNCFIGARILGFYVTSNKIYVRTYQTEYTLAVDGTNISYTFNDVGQKDVEFIVDSDLVIEI